MFWESWIKNLIEGLNVLGGLIYIFGNAIKIFRINKTKSSKLRHQIKHSKPTNISKFRLNIPYDQSKGGSTWGLDGYLVFFQQIWLGKTVFGHLIRVYTVIWNIQKWNDRKYNEISELAFLYLISLVED